MGGSYPFNLGRGGSHLKNMKQYMDEVWSALSGSGSTQGVTRYVDGTNGTATGDGLNWDNALSTIALAIADAAAGDTIVIAPGTYTITAVLTPLARMRFVADVKGHVPTVNIQGAITNLLEVDVAGVQFEGIEFEATDAAVTNLVDVADALGVAGLVFQNCWFNGGTQTTVDGINAVDATLILSALEVLNCRFYGGLVNAIDVGVQGIGNSRILYNTFMLDLAAGTSRAVNMADTTAPATGYGYEIAYNTVHGPSDGGEDAFPFVLADAESGGSMALGFIHDNVQRHGKLFDERRQWFVTADTDGDDNNPGDDPTHPLQTIAQAVTNAAAGDEIVLGPGTYSITAIIAITTARLRFVAQVPGPVPTVTVTDSGAGALTTLVTVDAAGVSFEGILFQASHADVNVLVGVADTVNSPGLSFKNCHFDADSNATVDAINAVDGTFTTFDLEVLGCRFYGGLVNAVDVGVLGIPRARILNNTFMLDLAAGTSRAINMADTTSSATGYGWEVAYNTVLGPSDGGADAFPWVHASGETTTGLGFIHDNVQRHSQIFEPRTWYVDGTNGSDTNFGDDPDFPVAGIAQAISNGGANDTIKIAPGTYTITAILVPKAYMKIEAMVKGPYPTVTVLGSGVGVASLVTVDVDGVSFEGILFQANHADMSRLVSVSTSATVDGLSFKGCWFDAVSFATVNGIELSVVATNATAGLTVDDCKFMRTDVGINVGTLGWGNSIVRNSVFECTLTTDIGITLADSSDSGPSGWAIVDNLFIGMLDGTGTTAEGINIGGTEDAIGVGIIARNYFADFAADPITQDKMPEGIVQNYYGEVNGTVGGTLITGGA